MFAGMLGAFILIPIIGILVTVLLFYFILKFYRNENKMTFPEKIRLLRKLVNIVIIIFIVSTCIVGLLLLLVGGTFSFMGASAGTLGILLGIAGAGIQIYFYYLIYKEYKVLINNFEQEKIFEDENVTAFKKIAKVSLWILLFHLAISLVTYVINLIMVAGLYTGNIFMFNGIDINFTFDTTVLVYFIICVILNILSVVFARAVEIHKENQLTI